MTIALGMIISHVRPCKIREAILLKIEREHTKWPRRELEVVVFQISTDSITIAQIEANSYRTKKLQTYDFLPYSRQGLRVK